MTLQPAQEELLAWMVDTARRVPRHEQTWNHGDGELRGPEGPRPVLDSDVRALAAARFLEATSHNYVYGDDYVLRLAATAYIDNMRVGSTPEVEPTGWDAVDAAVRVLRDRVASASNVDDYKAVGHQCNEAPDVLWGSVAVCGRWGRCRR